MKKVSTLLFGDVLSEVDRRIYANELIPKHGPGATADRLFGNQKWTQPVWHDRLETLFPYLEFALPNHRHWTELDGVEFLAPSAEPPVKLTAVAKTHTTPRLIAIEPTCMQYVQQAIARPLCHLLEAHKVSQHFVGFYDQEPNRFMAQIGSEDGSLATLDLSEASDRVANWLVEALYADFPWFSEGIQACRSTRVKLPTGEVTPILKFASMGSALTFPIEAMVFCAVALEAVLRVNDLPRTLDSIMKFRDQVRVFGDDIIVPTDCAETVIESLETFGFKVNRNKSFWTGEFRESCGKEFWNGFDVSIVRFRKRLPASRRDVDELVSTVATRNLLYQAGFRRTVARLDSLIEGLLTYYPWVSETSPVLGRLHESGLYQIDSVSEDTHAPKVRGYVVRPKIPFNEIDGVHALMKCFLESIGEPNADPEHLTRSGRPRVVGIKLVKASPF